MIKLFPSKNFLSLSYACRDAINRVSTSVYIKTFPQKIVKIFTNKKKQGVIISFV